MRVLFATDGSSAANAALRWGARFPHADQWDITVLQCQVPPVFSIHEDSMEWRTQYLDAAAAGSLEIQRQAADALKELGNGWRFITREGHAGDEITRYAREHRVDLIVLGATGHSTLSRILLGSVSDYVATHAPCSVLIVRPAVEGEDEDGRFVVTLTYDGSTQAKHGIDEFARVAWGKKIEVHLLHVSQNLYPQTGLMAATAIPWDTRHQMMTLDQLKKIAKQLPFSDPDPKVHLLEADHIGDAIVAFAARTASDLVFVGETGMSQIDRMLLGSVSRYVLRHATTSVWLSRSSGHPAHAP